MSPFESERARGYAAALSVCDTTRSLPRSQVTQSAAGAVSWQITAARASAAGRGVLILSSIAETARCARRKVLRRGDSLESWTNETRKSAEDSEAEGNQCEWNRCPYWIALLPPPEVLSG